MIGLISQPGNDLWWHGSYVCLFGMLWAPKKAKIDLQNCSKKAKVAKISQSHYGFIFFQQNLLHVVCFDAEPIQSMFSLKWLYNTVKYCPNTAKLNKLSKTELVMVFSHWSRKLTCIGIFISIDQVEWELLW